MSVVYGDSKNESGQGTLLSQTDSRSEAYGVHRKIWRPKVKNAKRRTEEYCLGGTTWPVKGKYVFTNIMIGY